MDAQPQKTEDRRSPLEMVLEPWELDGGSKRDCEPHRADLLSFLVTISNVAVFLYVLVFPFLIGIPAYVFNHKVTRRDPVNLACCLLCLFPPLLAIGSSWLTRYLAHGDLERMRTGDMDRSGFAATDQARRGSHTALLISLWGPLVWVILALLVGLGFMALLSQISFGLGP